MSEDEATTTEYVLTFVQDWFKLSNETTDAVVQISECLPEYRTRVAAAELGLQKFSSPQEKEEYLNQIPACFFPVYLHFYLDANFADKKQCVVILKNKAALNQAHRITVSGKYDPKEFTKDKCEVDPRLCIQAYITVLSECGSLCREDVGVSTLPLALVEPGSLELALRIHTLPQNPTKSKVGISHLVANKSITPWTRVSYELWRKERLASVKRMVNEYKHKTDLLESQIMHDFMKNAYKIKCPLSPSQITFDNSTLHMPIASFTMTPPLMTTVHFWLQELKIASQRHALNMNLTLPLGGAETFFYKHFSGMSVNHKCSFGMDMIVQYAQMLEYIGDYVINTNKQGKINIEIFGDAIVMHGGDCEDLSLAIMQLFDSFLNLEFPTQETVDSPSMKLLKELHLLLRFYVPFICIEGVTANNLMNATKDKKERKKMENDAPELTGAHGAVKFIPFSLLSQYLNTWNKDHALSKHVEQEAKRLGALMKTPPSEILIGEGTGMLEAGIFEDPLFALRQYIYSCPMMEKVKKPIIPPKRHISPFYQALLFGFTNRFIHSHGIGLFHFATKDPHLRYNTPSSTLPGRGAVFADFIRQDKNVYMMPNVLPGELREYSDELVCLMDAMVTTRIPTPLLQGFTLGFDPVISIEETKTLDHIEQRAQTLASENYANLYPMTDHCFAKQELELLRQLVTIRPEGTYQGSIYVCLLEDYVDPSFIAAIREFSTVPRGGLHVGSIKIEREYHDNAFYVYRLTFLLYK